MDCSGNSASLNGTGVISVGTSTFFFSGSLSTPTRDLKVTPEDSFRETSGETFSGGCGALVELFFSLPPYVRDGGALLFLKNDLDGFLYLTGRCFLSFFGFFIGFEGFFVFVFFLGGAAVVAGAGANENGAAAGVVMTTGAVKLK